MELYDTQIWLEVEVLCACLEKGRVEFRIASHSSKRTR